MQKLIVKLTRESGNPVLIGVESIVTVKRININAYDGRGTYEITEIISRGAMTTTTNVQESVEEIYNLINYK
jgi:hypothetical protein